MYQDALIDDIPDAKASDSCISIDYGTMNAFACLCWKKFGDIWCAVRGYYYSGRDTGVQKTDTEYLQDISERFSEEINEKPGKMEIIIDPSAASFIALLRKSGWAKVRPADNDVINGIRETASAMNSGKIKIWKGIKEWAEEMGGYTWEEGEGQERPVKINDHYCDATRYFVKTKKLMKQRRNIDKNLSAFL